MSEILNYVEDKQTSEFYPTPASLAKRLIDKIDWKYVQSVLEPSAGKGDIIRELAKRIRHNYDIARSEFEVDCIELDANLRAILKHSFSEDAEHELREQRGALVKQYGTYERYDYETDRYRYYDSVGRDMKDFPDDVQAQLKAYDEAADGFFQNGICVVHDDFLTYTNYKQYQAIIMNPPFSEGDKHLLKALDMQKNGGQIACLLNAETIRNPFTPARKHLVSLLDKYEADIEYIEDAFTDAERRTGVEVALVYVNIPYTDEDGVLSIYERMEKARDYEEPVFDECTEIEVTDMVQAIINRYKVEVESGIELIKTYRRMLPYLRGSISAEDKYSYDKPLILLKDDNGHDMTVNRYVKSVRAKYWKALLTNQKFVGKLTSKLQSEYSERVASYANYDFSEFNIYTLLTEMNAQVKRGIEDEISAMYDRLTEEHSYFPECQKNRHLYDGWKTNKAWKIDKKCIIPCHGVFDAWDGKPRSYNAYSVLSDIERILNFFDGHMTAEVDLSRQIQMYFNGGVTKKIPCKFFTVTFYKKGTVHIEFTCPELIDRFNIYAARQRGWLPPCYGKKQYKDMTAEEQSVVDSFQGKDAYAEVMRRADYYLASPVKADTLMLTVGTEEADEGAA